MKVPASLILVLLTISSTLAEDRSKSKAFTPSGPMLGPEVFFSDDFLLQVSKGIVIHVFERGNNASAVDVITLDQAAKSVKGSSINTNKTEMSFSLDWKSQVFMGEKKKVKLDGIMLKMTFQKKKKEFSLTKISADQMVLGGENMRDTEVKVKTKHGYQVSAPLGLAFGCEEPGMFPPSISSREDHKYRIGITFPGMMLQVFDLKEPKFGPMWDCGEVFSIALWVGLLVTFFFALVCWWGFSMLANISTNDRFEDPKGKPLQVPLGE